MILILGRMDVKPRGLVDGDQPLVAVKNAEVQSTYPSELSSPTIEGFGSMCADFWTPCIH